MEPMKCTKWESLSELLQHGQTTVQRGRLRETCRS